MGDAFAGIELRCHQRQFVTVGALASSSRPPPCQSSFMSAFADINQMNTKAFCLVTG